MPDKKILKGIKPFNKFGFRSCYYHQMIAAFARFGVDEKIWLMDYLPVYKYDKKESKLLIEDHRIFDDKQIEKITGLRLIKKKKSKDIITEIINSIDRGMPIIVCVDTYYLDYREDTYKKQRRPHFLLVYGYDKTTKTFTVNEHMYLNSPVYVERETDFGVIKKCFDNYVKRLSKPDSYGVIKIKKLRASAAFDLSEYKKMVAGKKKVISGSLEQIKTFCGFALSVIDDENILEKYMTPFTDSLGIVRWQKVVQKHQIMFVYDNAEIIETLDRVIEALIFIYGVLVKMKLTDSYNSQSVEKLRKKITDYLALEEKVHAFLLRGPV